MAVPWCAEISSLLLPGHEEAEAEEGNLLEWTVYDRAEMSMDYDLGEIANRSFRDKYGIWAGQDEIYPTQEETGGDRNSREMAEEAAACSVLETYIRETMRTLRARHVWDIKEAGRAEQRKEEDCNPDISHLVGEERVGLEREQLGQIEESTELDTDVQVDYYQEGESDIEVAEMEGGFTTATQKEGLAISRPDNWRENEGGRNLSPIGSRRRASSGGPCFISGMYQDEDRRLAAVAEKGGLTFAHAAEGDIELVEHDGTSTIPLRHPPMSESTVDWSLIYRPENKGALGIKKGRKSKEGSNKDKAPGKGKACKGARGDVGETKGKAETALKQGQNIRLRKGRYSKKRSSHRGGRNKKRKQGFLSDEDFEQELDRELDTGTEACVVEAMEGMGTGTGNPGLGERGALTEEAAAGEETSAEEARDREKGVEEDPGNERREQKKRPRRRVAVVTIEEGHLRASSGDRERNKRSQIKMARVWPGRSEIITQDMADPNRNIIGHRSQEVPIANARTSGVFWCTSKTRDNRRFPGTAEKTLLRQGLESVSVEGNEAGGEGQDPLRWPGVRPPEVGPR